MEAIETSEFDLVVIGTGLIESILAASAAKAGKTVLQLDPSDRYGGNWASLHLDEFIQRLQTSPSTSTEAANGDATAATDTSSSQNGDDGIFNCHILQPSSTTTVNLGSSSEYNLDLAPKLMYGAGPMIHLLLGSSAHHYLEFKLIQGSFLYTADGVFRPVPSSRPDIFRDRYLGPLQKRTLMRFLKGCSEALEGQGSLAEMFDERPFIEIMNQEQLDPQLQEFIRYGVFQHTHSNTTLFSGRQALDTLKVFGESLGRYGIGTGAYLTPLYGCGELPQAFCRVAAVSGALQMLRCEVQGLSFDEHTFACTGVELGTGQFIRCTHLAAQQSTLSEWLTTFKPTTTTTITHHCVAVLDRKLLPDESQSLFAVPPSVLTTIYNNKTTSSTSGTDTTTGTITVHKSPVYGLVLTHSTLVCPEDTCLLYLWTHRGSTSSSHNNSSSNEDAEEQGVVGDCKNILLPVLESLVNMNMLIEQETSGTTATTVVVERQEGESRTEGKPRALFAAFYSQKSISLVDNNNINDNNTTNGDAHIQQQSSNDDLGSTWPRNVVLCGGPTPSVLFVDAVSSAKTLFTRLYPDIQRFPLDAPGGTDTTAEEGTDTIEDGAATTNANGNNNTGDVDSDDEALAALRDALRGLDGGGGGDAAASEET